MQNSSAKILPKGTILYTIFATIGEVGILGINASCNQAIAGIQTYLRSIDGYLYYYLVNLQDFMKSISKGCAQFNINQKILKEAFVPLPPLAEQDRIVSEIEKIEPLIAEYDKLEQQATKLDGEIYDKLKKSILQYAIQGKLVPQDSNDEPAAVLLERIRTEKKAQLGKKYVESYIYKGDDNCYYEKVGSTTKNITAEIPFDIPNSWSWIRLSNITTLITKGTTPRGDAYAYTNSGIGFLRAENIVGFDKISKKDLKYVNETTHYNFLKRSILEENDILITIAGTLGRTGMVIKEDLPLNANQAVSIVRVVNGYKIDLLYLIFVLNAPIIKKCLLSKSVEMAIPNLSLENISDCVIPLPPFQEQYNITKKINQLFEILKGGD